MKAGGIATVGAASWSDCPLTFAKGGCWRRMAWQSFGRVAWVMRDKLRFPMDFPTAEGLTTFATPRYFASDGWMGFSGNGNRPATTRIRHRLGTSPPRTAGVRRGW
jgi:hypothetical protein